MAAEEPLTQPEFDIKEEFKSPEKRKRKAPKDPHEYESDDDLKPSTKVRKTNGANFASHNPSYCLKRDIGNSQCAGESLRSQHRKRLWRILKQLIRQHNWAEASGVLSVLIQATGSDQSLSGNRAKYSAALELLNHIKGGTISTRKAQSVYELWMKKTGPLKNWSLNNKFAVQLEFILFCLQYGRAEEAHQASLCLMQEKGFENDPVSNMIVGITFSQLWYTSLPKESQLTDMDTSTQPENQTFDLYASIKNSNENDFLESGGDKSPVGSDSYTSIANGKEVSEMEIDEKSRKGTSNPKLEPQDFYLNSAEGSENRSGDVPHASIFHTQGLPPWLLPLKLPDSHVNLEDAVYLHRKLHNDHYKSALKHLRVALYSTAPVIEALHPLIQMLLLGDQVSEAIRELENVFHSSDTVLQLRLKAGLWEHFDGGNCTKISTCFEDILKKDPTCSHSLERLIIMHRRGNYATTNLAEMISLHLDATYGTWVTWNELASCFLKLSLCEEDRASACHESSGQYSQEMDTCNKIPEIFTDSESGKSWRFRCKWWLKRHFHNNILLSDTKSGDLQLLTYKAAAASHIYGRHFKYVLKATEYLEKENNMEMYSLLQTHILNSVGYYSIKRNT